MKKRMMITCIAIFFSLVFFQIPYVSGATIESITVYERTAYVLPFTFMTNDSRLGKDPQFGQESFDFTFFAGGTEVYDVYISNSDGTPNWQGMYFTIDCIRPEYDTGGSAGHNIDAVSIDYDDGSHSWATVFTAYSLGYNQTLESANPNAALGEPDDIPTYMGDQFSSLTVGFGLSQPIIANPFDLWTAAVSLPLKFTRIIVTGGNTSFVSDKETYNGTIQAYFLDRSLVSNQNGCYLSLVSNDGKLSMCFNKVAFISQEWSSNDKKPEGFILMGTGDFTSTNGASYTGPISLDAKGTWKDNSQKQFMKIKGTLSGGDNGSFIFKGSFNALLSK